MNKGLASRVAEALARIGVTRTVLSAEDVRRSWGRVVRDQAIPNDPVDNLLWRWHYALVVNGNIANVDRWLTRAGRVPKGLARRKVA